jgi:hypothetical protein
VPDDAAGGAIAAAAAAAVDGDDNDTGAGLLLLLPLVLPHALPPAKPAMPSALAAQRAPVAPPWHGLRPGWRGGRPRRAPRPAPAAQGAKASIATGWARVCPGTNGTVDGLRWARKDAAGKSSFVSLRDQIRPFTHNGNLLFRFPSCSIDCHSSMPTFLVI